MHIGESHVAAAEAVGELFVVDSNQVKHCGVQVVHFSLVLNRLVTEFIGRSISRAAANSST